MIKNVNKFYDETYYTHTFSSGLKAFIVPKEGFTRTIAMIGVGFGSMCQEYKVNGKTIKTPAGVAHYLEHKMFELPDHTSASDVFASLGARDNAFTSFEETVYRFSTIDNFYPCLDLLLKMVSSLDVTDESMEKERGIITEELSSYLNVPEEQIVNHFLEQAYSKNYVRDDIGGTVEGIKAITKETLLQVFTDFYHPKNMFLTIVGNVDVEKAIDFIENHELGHTKKPYSNPLVNYNKDDEILKDFGTYHMDVPEPKILIGSRLAIRDLTKEERFKANYYFSIMLDVYFASSSPIYQSLLREQKLDYSFGYDLQYQDNFAFFYFSINGKNKEEKIKVLKDLYNLICTRKVTKEEFNHYLNNTIASSIKQFNNLLSMARYIIELGLEGIDPIASTSLLNEMTYEEFLKVTEDFKNLPLITTIIEK